MMQQIKHWLAPPVFPTDEAATRRAGLLNAALINIMTLLPVIVIGNALGGRTPLPVFAANAAAVALCLVLRGWMHRGRVRLASIGLMTLGFILITASAASLGTIRTPTAAMYPLLVITAGLLFDLAGMIATTALCSLVVAGLIAAENAGVLPRPDYTVTITQWIAYTAICGWTGSLTLSALQALRQALARVEHAMVERALTDKAWRESEERYRSLFENSIDAILLTVPDGGILAANPEACRIFGRTEAEICQVGRSGVIDAEDPRLPAALEERVRTGKFKGELTGLRKDGTRFPIEISSSVFKDREGNLRTSMTIRDIAKRKRVEDALRASQAMLEEAQRIAHAGSWEWIAETDKPTWSKELCNILEVDPEKPVPSMAEQDKLYTPESMVRMRTLVEKTMRTGDPYEIELERVRADGSRRWLLARGERWHDEKGQLIGLRGTALDITERRQAVEQLRALSAHQLMIREEESGRIARTVHDDLGQALTGLKMDLSWLGNQLAAVTDPTVRRLLREKVQGMAELTGATINTVRRITAELRPGVLDDLGLVAALEWQAQDFERRSGIRCEFASDLADLTLDRDRATELFRICQEALTNVARHAGASRVNVSLDQAAGQLILQVQDNGRGITAGELADPQAFGLLGMAERARLAGGELTIGGQPGQGTTVTVRVPLG